MPPFRWIPEQPAGVVFDQPMVSLLLDAVRGSTLAPSFLRAVNRLAPAAYISLVRYDVGGPVLLEGHAHEALPHNITHDCWARYRERFFRLDELPRLAHRLRCEAAPSEGLLALHCTTEQIPDAGWRDQVYRHGHLSDRLTLLYAPLRGLACSINLYRTEDMGPFGEAELSQVLGLAPLLKQVHGQVLGASEHDIDRRIGAAEQALATRTAQLSPRERQVCARIACGLSVDGIAADLGVAASTVLTLRKRAYAKLDVHNRIDLVRWLH